MDYSSKLPLEDSAFDLLVSLYAGPVSLHCTEYLSVDGLLLVNPSHGDVALASIDPRYELAGTVRSADSDYRVDTEGLDAYLIPKKPTQITVDGVLSAGRGVAYTKSPFAYVFRRIQ